MKKLWIATTVALGLQTLSFAQATIEDRGATGMNTTFGPTGLITVPNAYTVRNRELRLGGTWGKEFSGPTGNYGIIDFIEVGGAYVMRRTRDDKAIAHGKVTLYPSNLEWLTVGIGVIDPFDAIDQTAYFVGSVDLSPKAVGAVKEGAEAASRQVAVGFRAHAGVGTGLFRERLIGGGELIFDNHLAIIGEYDAVNLNMALRYKTKSNVQVQAGLRDKKIFLGLTAPVEF
jgi:hypothetical protein